MLIDNRGYSRDRSVHSIENIAAVTKNMRQNPKNWIHHTSQ